MYRRLLLAFTAICLWGSVYALSTVNTYMTAVDIPVEVKQVYSGTSTGKYSHLEFIAVYQTQDNILFDRRISASTFYQLKPGDKITMSLRPFDLRQNWVDNAIWFAGANTYTVLGIAGGIILLIMACWFGKGKSNEDG